MESFMTDQSQLLRDALLAKTAGQDFLHGSAAQLSPEVQQAARDNLAMLDRIITEEEA
jgi:hypothetical protein